MVPVLLDLLFWLGPRLSVAPLLERSFSRLAAPGSLPADLVQSYEEAREVWLQAVEDFNLLALLANHFPGIPSLMAARVGAGPEQAVQDPWTALGLFLLLPVAGLGLASVYYVSIGLLVRGGREGAGAIAGRLRRTWWRLLGLLLLLLGLGLALSVPVGVALFVAGMANGAVVGFLGAFLWVTLMWVLFYLFFVVDAVVLTDVGPLRAVRHSMAVVRFNMGSALGLIGLTWIIMLGMPIVWDALATTTAGTVVAILGNAYISAGLAAASMIYYRDRYAALGK